MRKDLVEEIVCPACRSRLRLDFSEVRNAEAWTGELTCEGCAARYPVVRGLPQLLAEPVLEQDQHWDRVHNRWDAASLAANIRRRFELPEEVLLDYYPHAGLVRAWGRRPARVLELGAGSGAYTLALQRLAGAGRACLLDISLPALEHAAAIFAGMGVAADFVQADIRFLPFPDRAFDLAVSGGLIEHFAGDEQTAVLAEHGRVAAAVLIQAPQSTWAYWLFRSLYSLRPGGWPYGFERPLTRGRLARLLAGAGFRVEAWGGHDFAASVELLGRLRWPAFPRLHRWPGLAAVTRHDLIALAVRAETA